MMNLPTKFEVGLPDFTCYGNMKGVAKCKNGVVWGDQDQGHPRSLKIAQFDKVHTSSY